MAIRDSIARLSAAARELNKLATDVRENVDAVNRTLRELAPPGEHLYPRPLDEETLDFENGRETHITYLVFADIDGERQLAIQQHRVFESKGRGYQRPGPVRTFPLSSADLSIQMMAINRLPDLVNALRQDGQRVESLKDIFEEAPTRMQETVKLAAEDLPPGLRPNPRGAVIREQSAPDGGTAEYPAQGWPGRDKE